MTVTQASELPKAYAPWRGALCVMDFSLSDAAAAGKVQQFSEACH